VNESAISMPKWVPFDSMHPFDQFMSISKCVLPKDCTGENASRKKILAIRKTWYAMVAETDAMMGHVIEALNQNPNVANNTYIIFTSDHGEMNMEHRQWFKNAMFEASTRVPLIISGPGIVQGKLVTNLTSLLDIFPTIMELGGVSFDEDIEGFSLVPFLREEDHPIQQWWKPIKNTKTKVRPDHVVSQFHSNFGNTGSFMIRKGSWKYIAFGPTPPYHYPPRLFNVDQDPEELSDVVSDYPDVATNLDQLLRSIIDYPTVDAEVKKQDLENYLSWVQDGHEDDPWTDFWTQTYRGFDEQDKAKVKDWISRSQPVVDTHHNPLVVIE